MKITDEQIEIQLKSKIEALWKVYEGGFGDDELNKILEKGFVYSIPHKREILITGINPSCKKSEEERLQRSFYWDKKIDKNGNSYFRKIETILEAGGIKPNTCSYLDLFCFRGEQNLIKSFFKEKKHGVEFLAKHLALTQSLIEEIQPKLILVFNREAGYYWGRNAEKKGDSFSNVWMGYKFELVQPYNNGDSLLKIVGFVESNERVARHIKETKLNGSLVYFSRYMGGRWVNQTERDKVSENLKSIIQKNKTINAVRT